MFHESAAAHWDEVGWVGWGLSSNLKLGGEHPPLFSKRGYPHFSNGFGREGGLRGVGGRRGGMRRGLPRRERRLNLRAVATRVSSKNSTKANLPSVWGVARRMADPGGVDPGGLVGGFRSLRGVPVGKGAISVRCLSECHDCHVPLDLKHGVGDTWGRGCRNLTHGPKANIPRPAHTPETRVMHRGKGRPRPGACEPCSGRGSRGVARRGRGRSLG